MNNITTLQDCADEYQRYMEESNRKYLQQETDNRLKAEAKVVEAFFSIGLEPKRVEGFNAFFDYNGSEIHFVVVEWKYGQTAVYGVLEEKCQKCGEQLLSDEFIISKENIGYLLVSPTARYHDCQNWNQDADINIEKTASVEERLVGILRELVAEALNG